MPRHFGSTLLLGFGILTRNAVSTVVWPFKEQLLNLSIPALQYGRLYLVPGFTRVDDDITGISASRGAEAHSGEDHYYFYLNKSENALMAVKFVENQNLYGIASVNVDNSAPGDRGPVGQPPKPGQTFSFSMTVMKHWTPDDFHPYIAEQNHGWFMEDESGELGYGLGESRIYQCSYHSGFPSGAAASGGATWSGRYLKLGTPKADGSDPDNCIRTQVSGEKVSPDQVLVSPYENLY